MKKTKIILGGIALCLLSITMKAQTVPPTSQPVKTWEAKNNPTVDSITSQYATKYIAPVPALNDVDFFPVIGEYKSTTNPDAASVTITLDTKNKGVVWIVGLPQGKIKAMLRKSPATYKIPAQKSEEGKDITEGTLIFNAETADLNICIGNPYHSENPELVFSTAIAESEVTSTTNKKSTKSKTKTVPKAWFYAGTKQNTETVLN